MKNTLFLVFAITLSGCAYGTKTVDGGNVILTSGSQLSIGKQKEAANAECAKTGRIAVNGRDNYDEGSFSMYGLKWDCVTPSSGTSNDRASK